MYRLEKKILLKLRDFVINYRIHRERKISDKLLRSNTGLWAVLSEYCGNSGSTGVSSSDYWALYSWVRKNKPKEVLECGTGVTTVVLAYALMENERDDGVKGRLTTMEEHAKWQQQAKELLPAKLTKYVDFRVSTRVEDYYSIFRGVRYANVPDRKYDFVFIDGPNSTSPSDGMKTFDIDYIKIVERSHTPVWGVVDNRLNSSYIFQKVLGVKKARYDVAQRLCWLGPCARNDLRVSESKSGFSESFRAFGTVRLNLIMQRKSS